MSVRTVWKLLQIADAVAREKSIDRMIVIDAMQDAIQKAAKSRYGIENDIRCAIDPKTGATQPDPGSDGCRGGRERVDRS